MKRIKIKASTKTYFVNIGEKLGKETAKFINKHPYGKNLFFIVDSRLMRIHGEKIRNLSESLPAVKKKFYKLSATEENKSYSEMQKIHEFMLKHHYGRDTLIIAIGGGITGDLSGFVASTYMRGVPYVQIPTTILAAVDSSVGGKTGINLLGFKNIVGSFYQPEAVFADTEFFETLPYEEKLCGFGEILKYAFLANENFLKFITKNTDAFFANETKALSRIIGESVKLKAAVVSADETEKGLRKILNLGHTFGHAIEAAEKHKIKHGQAVIAGLFASLNLARFMNLIDEKNFLSLSEVLGQFKGKIKLSVSDVSKIYSSMKKDKKNREGKIKFVLIGAPGVIYPEIEAPKNLVIKSLRKTVEYFV